jgi:hypothetical protein
MNNEQVNELIKGIGLITELWMITYKAFESQGLSNEDATMQTKALMSIMVNSIVGTNNGEEKQ